MTVPESLAVSRFLTSRVPVSVEVFSLFFGPGGTIAYTFTQSPLGPECPDPDCMARELSVHPPDVLHSTSWRWEDPGCLVLTYLAVLDQAHSDAMFQVVQASDFSSVVETNPRKPRPDRISRLAVLGHGLRHLSFLAADPTQTEFRTALGPAARETLGALPSGPAGRLG